MIRSPSESVVTGMGFETLTVGATPVTASVGLTKVDGQGNGARHALFSVETNSIRFRYDGTTGPTAAIGHLVPAGKFFEIHGSENIGKLQMIATGAAATVQATYSQ